MPWAPLAQSGSVPPYARYVDAPVAVLASLNDYAENLGHAVYDFLFPVFNVMQLFNLYTPNFQLLLAKHQVLTLFNRHQLGIKSVTSNCAHQQSCFGHSMITNLRCRGMLRWKEWGASLIQRILAGVLSNSSANVLCSP